MRDEAGYEEFARARTSHLLRLAHALTGSPGRGRELVVDALSALRTSWPRYASTAEHVARERIVRSYLRQPAARAPVGSVGSARAWAALVLSRLESLSDAQVAGALGTSQASVRRLFEETSASSDAEAQLRSVLDVGLPNDEETEVWLRIGEGADRRRRARKVTLLALLGFVVVGLVVAAVALARSGPAAAALGPQGQAAAMATAGPKQVWALAPDPKCGGCSTLWFGDGTSAGWTELHTFDHPAGGSHIQMARNGEDGWVWFARDSLLATHDGGETWAVPNLDVLGSETDLQAAGSTVWALLSGQGQPTLWTAEIGSDTWSQGPIPTGDYPSYALAPLGRRMFVVEYAEDGRTWMRKLDGTGRDVLVPCADPPVPPRSVGHTMYVTCPDDGDGVAVKSTVDGVSWTSLLRSIGTAADSYPVSATQTFVVTGKGGRLVSALFAGDVPLELASTEAVVDGGFPTKHVGFLLTDGGRLLRTGDGGRTWHQVG